VFSVAKSWEKLDTLALPLVLKENFLLLGLSLLILIFAVELSTVK
jgi:hypothetical protein